MKFKFVSAFSILFLIGSTSYSQDDTNRKSAQVCVKELENNYLSSQKTCSLRGVFSLLLDIPHSLVICKLKDNFYHAKELLEEALWDEHKLAQSSLAIRRVQTQLARQGLPLPLLHIRDAILNIDFCWPSKDPYYRRAYITELKWDNIVYKIEDFLKSKAGLEIREKKYDHWDTDPMSLP